MNFTTTSASKALQASVGTSDRTAHAPISTIHDQKKNEAKTSSSAEAPESSKFELPAKNTSLDPTVESTTSLDPGVPRLSYASVLSSHPPLRPRNITIPKPVSVAVPTDDVGKIVLILGKTETQLDHKDLHDNLSKGDKMKGHMVVVCGQEVRDNLVYFAVGTLTSRHVPGLPSKYLVPIFPFEGDFKPDDSHNTQYRLDNEDSTWTAGCGRSYQRKTNKDCYLRRDNTYWLPKVLTKPSEGENGHELRLSADSLADYLDFLDKENIIKGSQADPLWKLTLPVEHTPPRVRRRFHGPGGRREFHEYGSRQEFHGPGSYRESHAPGSRREFHGRGDYGFGDRETRRGGHNRVNSTRGGNTTPTIYPSYYRSPSHNRDPRTLRHGPNPVTYAPPTPSSSSRRVAENILPLTRNHQEAFGENSDDKENGTWTKVSHSKTVKRGGSSWRR